MVDFQMAAERANLKMGILFPESTFRNGKSVQIERAHFISVEAEIAHLILW